MLESILEAMLQDKSEEMLHGDFHYDRRAID